MHGAFRVFLRDFKRILRVPKAWVIIIGLIIMPSLYAWVNIIAFWDPYSDTKAVDVAVVNLDEGASSPATGELNVGKQVVAQLKDNHDLGWQFLSKDEAMKAVKSGESYAAYVIPANFSKDLLSITTGDFVRPKLHYYVNEKANAISPKITDVGASTIETQINSNFVSTVAKTVAQDLEKAGVQAGDQLLRSKNNTLAALDSAVDKIETAREGLTDTEDSLEVAEAALTDTKQALLDVDSTIDEVQVAVDEAQALVSEVQRELATFTDEVTNAYVKGSAHLSEVSSELNSVITKLSAGAQQANAEIGSAVNDASAVVEANGKALTELKELLAGLDPSSPAYKPLKDAVNKLESRNKADQKFLRDLQTLNGDVTDVITAIEASADAINTATQESADSASAIRGVLMGTIPEINQSMSAMSEAAGAFSSALGSQQVLLGETVDLLTGLQGQLEDTVTALEALDGNLEDAEQGLKNLRTDVEALSSADIWNKVRALTSLDPNEIAEFMASPVEVKQHTLFPVTTYGSAMAPLFTNLSLWIGAFMLVVLMKQEVDTEGIDDLTVRQAYLGRFMLLSVLNILQALLVSIGNVVIGIQTVSAVAFIATTVFTGLVYLAIIYALAITFGYIGKGAAILLLIIQIPGASGIYPIEMMPGFFRALFPFFPFTYGIDAMRETIGGFYDGYYWRYVAVLLLYAVLAFILGIFLRQRLGNFQRLINKNLSDVGLFISEDVQILGSRRRLTQIVEALSDRRKFVEKTEHQQEWFTKHHMNLIRLTLAIGLALTAVLGIFAGFFPTAKATILGLWGLLIMLVIAALITFEYVKQNIVYATKLSKTADPELHEELKHEQAATRSTATLEDLNEHGRHR
ncbi:MAG: YhgE/Pip family protein [Leucobacter sp.]